MARKNVDTDFMPDWLPVADAPMNPIEQQFLQEEVSLLRDRLSSTEGNNELLLEELNNIVGRMTDATEIGWVEMTTGTTQVGLQLQILKNISGRLRDMTDTNPLLRRAHQLRRDYVYAQGVDIEVKPDSAKTIVERRMNDPYNYELFFSEEGHDTLMKSRFTDGNRFTLVNRKTGDTVHLPLSQVENAVVDVNDPSRIKYIARSLGGKTTWYATDLYSRKAKT